MLPMLTSDVSQTKTLNALGKQIESRVLARRIA
jgi:hypothetical protein